MEIFNNNEKVFSYWLIFIIISFLILRELFFKFIINRKEYKEKENIIWNIEYLLSLKHSINVLYFWIIVLLLTSTLIDWKITNFEVFFIIFSFIFIYISNKELKEKMNNFIVKQIYYLLEDIDFEKYFDIWKEKLNDFKFDINNWDIDLITERFLLY